MPTPRARTTRARSPAPPRAARPAADRPRADDPRGGTAGFARIVGQERAVRVLRETLRAERLANAYLFEGPWGVGKTRTARLLAQAVQCRRLEDDACEECDACLRVASFQHPDVRFLFPVMGDEDDPDSIAATLRAVAEDEHHVFTYEKASSIRIGLTRELLRELAFRPYEGRRRIVVLRDADRMREDQYSAMLKSLEEPGESTVWVLTTSRPNRLPATIRSRCLKLRFRALDEETIERYLDERAGVRPAEARLLAALASGSLGRALLLRGEDVTALRDQALRALGDISAHDPARVLEAATQAAGYANRERMRRTLEFQALWLRDLLRLAHGAPEATLVHRDRAADLRRIAAGLDAREVRRRALLLEEAARAVDSNVAADAAFFSAYARWGRLVPQDARARAEAWPGWDPGRVES